MEQLNQTYIVVFDDDGAGKHTGRLAEISVELDLNMQVLTCTKIAPEDVFPCEKSQCPHDADPDESNCYDKCIYAYEKEGYDWVHCVGRARSSESIVDVVAEFRNVVRSGTDGVGHRKRWPQLTKIFAQADWIVGDHCFSPDGGAHKMQLADESSTPAAETLLTGRS